MRPWSIEECEAYAQQLRGKSRANTAEHAAQAIEYLLGLVRRQWQGLTDDEIDECERLATIRHQRHKYSVRGQIITPADGLEWHFAGVIEAKLKEKNHG